MKTLIILTLVSLLFIINSSFAQSSCDMKVQVWYGDVGTPSPYAYVTIVGYCSGNANFDGQFSCYLQEGYYDVTAYDGCQTGYLYHFHHVCPETQTAEVIIPNCPNRPYEKHSPNEFALFQNYPNPFNPATVIQYEIPKESFVTLKIYDITGGEVQTLVNETEVAGSYQVSFNAEELPSGMYFYTIKAGDFTENRKMLLIK